MRSEAHLIRHTKWGTPNEAHQMRHPKWDLASEVNEKSGIWVMEIVRHDFDLKDFVRQMRNEAHPMRHTHWGTPHKAHQTRPHEWGEWKIRHMWHGHGEANKKWGICEMEIVRQIRKEASWARSSMPSLIAFNHFKPRVNLHWFTVDTEYRVAKTRRMP